MTKKDLNKLSVEELKKELDSLEKQKERVSNKGKEYCIVRAPSSGVFAGMFDRKTKGREGTVFQARRIWHWKGASTLSQLAIDGPQNIEGCKFPQAVPEVDLKTIVEVIPCTKTAREGIEKVPIWQK